MDTIIEKLSESQNIIINLRNQIIGGIGTIEGRIWIAYMSKRVVRMPIISSDRNIPIHQPINAIQNLERGPTGNHDLIISEESSVHLFYCHQTICKIDGGGNATLCGRTHLMFSDISEDSDSGDDETGEYELKIGEHLHLIYGIVRVRVSASGHRIYLTDCVKYEKFGPNIINEEKKRSVYIDMKNLYLSRSKLKQSSQVSALLSGFALVAMVEMDVEAEKVPLPLLLLFIIVTTLLVSVHMLALMIATCILPHIDAVASLHDGQSPLYYDSPHEKMRHYTSIAWSFSTVIGIFLFLIELAIIVWVKFWDIYGGWVAIASTIMLMPVFAAFVFFAFHFYRQLVAYKFEKTERVLHELEELAEQMNERDLNIKNTLNFV